MPLSTFVPLTCPLVSSTAPTSRVPVRGVHWQDLGAAANHLLGRGGELIPPAYCGQAIATGSTTTYRVRLFPRVQTTHRAWFLHLTTTGSASITFTDISGGTHTATVASTITNYQRALMFIEEIAAPDSAEITAGTVSIASAAGAAYSSCTLRTISCFEIPRPELAKDALEYGVDLDTVGGGLPIYDGANESIGGIVAATTQALSVAKRNGLFYALRGNVSPFNINGVGYTNLFAHDPVLLDRQLYRSETTRSALVRAYGITGATTTMDLRFTMASGATLTLSWSAGDTGSWKTGNLAIHVEDLGDPTGIRSSIHDTCTIEGRRPSGSNAAQIESICIGGSAS